MVIFPADSEYNVIEELRARKRGWNLQSEEPGARSQGNTIVNDKGRNGGDMDGSIRGNEVQGFFFFLFSFMVCFVLLSLMESIRGIIASFTTQDISFNSLNHPVSLGCG